jgi:hypothetical protein
VNEKNTIAVSTCTSICLLAGIFSLLDACSGHYEVETLREQTIQKAFDNGYTRVVTPDYPKATIWTKPTCPACKEREAAATPVEADAPAK